MTLSAAGQEIVRAELRRRTPIRGTVKQLAYTLRTSPQHMNHVISGRSAVSEAMAWRILAQARREDLALADKIEAELLGGEMLKEGE